MKRVDKYFKTHNQNSLAEELINYKELAAAIQNDKVNVTYKRSSPLSMIIPFAAASLSAVGINAQCGAVVIPQPGELGDFLVDIDGDGTNDFEIAEQGSDLFIFALNGNEVAATDVGGGFFYATNFSTGDVISSGAPFQNANLPANAGNTYATLFYDNNGNWAPSGSGFVGVRINGDQLGFIQVTWNGTNTVTVNAALSGSQGTTPGVNSIQAGICATLPVELTKFDVKIEKGNSMLQWSTLSEVNNEGFEVQRSTDGQEFRRVGWVLGQGNSDTKIDYMFEDKFIESNTQYYYRLKQVDLDGRYEFSSILNVMDRDESKIIVDDIFPNPASNNNVTLNVSAGIKGALDIQIYDAMGQVLFQSTEKVNEGSNVIDLNISELSSGSYFVKVGSQDFTVYKKLVIAK